MTNIKTQGSMCITVWATKAWFENFDFSHENNTYVKTES